MWIKEAEQEATSAPPKYRSLFFPQSPRRSHQRPSPPLTRLSGRLCSHSDGEKVDKAASQRCIQPAFLGPSGRVGSDRLYWRKNALRCSATSSASPSLLPRLWLLWIPPRCGSQPARFCFAELAARAPLDRKPKPKLSGLCFLRWELAGPKEPPGLESPRSAVFAPIKPTAYLALVFYTFKQIMLEA